ncbi:hypothetical protein [Bradyrhizobium canariense]|uniref:hypothetical protein n=1 Tax=Bradyrhizobium canariense TaxID=255045 RepID=UPI0011BAB237|nr:hypothetical protein [Bradyrhizobium canariense]
MFSIGRRAASGNFSRAGNALFCVLAKAGTELVEPHRHAAISRKSRLSLIIQLAYQDIDFTG